MVFDDLQWADSASRDLIGYLMRTIEREPLMILGLVRRGGTIDPQHPLAEWMRLQANYRSYTSLTLKPLSEGACRQAIEAIFGGPLLAPELPPQDFRTLYRMTGGNPYFLSEMLRLAGCGRGDCLRWCTKASLAMVRDEGSASARNDRHGGSEQVRQVVTGSP
jgi:predicted ATPase